jgi:antitoxin VapB
MAVARSRTFRSGNSEALRLPKDVASGEDVELVLVRSSNVMVIYPAAASIAEMLATLRTTPASQTAGPDDCGAGDRASRHGGDHER